MIEMMQQMEFNWQKTNYSPPDSTGKQYPTSTETATGTSTRQEKETYNEQLQVQIQEIQETLLTLKEQLENRRGMIQRSLKRSRTFLRGQKP